MKIGHRFATGSRAIPGPTGEQNPYVPVAHGRHAAEVIAHARLVLLPGRRHLSPVQEIPQLCVDLIAASKGAAR
jgi:pimeloyl-ACP methyl ester carboxylesterase